MKDWTSWGIKRRVFPDKNYNAIWYNLKTLRLGTGQASELDYPEFYDIGINTKCNLNCPMCYVSAKSSGVNYTDICEKAKFFFGQMTGNERPFQVAIGSTGEPSLHESFCEFLETLFYLGIVPNYTTNGITIAEDSDLSTKILDYTSRFVGGVAVSANEWSEHISKAWRRAIYKLDTFGNTNINIHYIIKDIESVNKFLDIYKEFKYTVLYFVLLPLMPSGRSKEKYSEDDLDWTDDNSRVTKEHEDKSLRNVELKTTTVENWDQYDTVLIGYPIWWGIAAWPVDTFVKTNDFSDKTVIPFCTSASSGLGESGTRLQKEAKGGNWK